MPVEADILPPRYRSPKRIAIGGMGEIYRATDASLGRDVAVKILSGHYARDDAIRSRFTREALAAARLSAEPHVVTVFDVGEYARRPFIVMEYLGGGSLEERLREDGAPEVGQALDWLGQAAVALDAAHQHRVVHRDVKPANLLLDADGDVHVADFGVARAADMDSMTLTGTVLGTAGYLSPEQALGEHATAASDRYSLAVVAYELLSGHRPFERDSITAEASAHVHDPVPPISSVRSGLPRDLDAVFGRALAKDPAERFETAADFVATLRAAFADAAGVTRPFATATAPTAVAAATRRDRSIGPWVGVVALLAAAAVGGAIAAFLLARGDDGKKATPPPRASTVTTVVTKQGTTARATIAAAPTQGPQSGSQLNFAGYAKMQAGNFAAALPLLQEAVAKLSGVGYPNEAYANYNLGYTLLQLGRCGEAVTYLERARQLEPWRHEPKDALHRTKHCTRD